MRTTKIISFFLGFSMFMVGVLKFVNPFKSWYAVQVANSGLGEISYAMGIAGEIFTGTILLTVLFFREKITNKFFTYVIVGASVIIIIMMATGIYVHLHPAVPAEVLPLKIKPPYIPGFFILLALINSWLTLNQSGERRKK